MANGRILIYGATGYTGKLVAREAARRGLDVVLAGRDAKKLAPLGEAHGFETRAVSLDDAARLAAAGRRSAPRRCTTARRRPSPACPPTGPAGPRPGPRPRGGRWFRR